MSQARRAEADDVRRWDGVVAARNELDDQRRFVVWGTGAPPPDLRGTDEAADLADAFVRPHDPEWCELPEGERWAVVVTADETDIDELTADASSVRGHAPYLAPGRTDEAGDTGMDSPLRDDVAPRRKVDQPRPV